MSFDESQMGEVTSYDYAISLARTLVDKGVLTDDDFLAVGTRAEAMAASRLKGWEEFKNTTPAERRKLYRHLAPVEEGWREP